VWGQPVGSRELHGLDRSGQWPLVEERRPGTIDGCRRAVRARSDRLLPGPAAAPAPRRRDDADLLRAAEAQRPCPRGVAGRAPRGEHRVEQAHATRRYRGVPTRLPPSGSLQ
jgi:hypothetical protein